MEDLALSMVDLSLGTTWQLFGGLFDLIHTLIHATITS